MSSQAHLQPEFTKYRVTHNTAPHRVILQGKQQGNMLVICRVTCGRTAYKVAYRVVYQVSCLQGFQLQA